MNRLLAEKCEDIYLVHEIFPCGRVYSSPVRK